MFRLTRPIFQVLKTTTGLTGIPVHPNPLPALVETYQSTLTTLNSIPPTSVYRQGVEALTKRKLGIVQGANGDVAVVEKALDEGQIEEAVMIAKDELELAGKMIEWKAYVNSQSSKTRNHIFSSWEPLTEHPQPGQWEYPGRVTEYKTS